MPTVNQRKNRDRERPSFANINFLGRCNVDCYFCLGKDIREELEPHNHTGIHFHEWPHFQRFLNLCRQHDVMKLYITGQNVDSLQYAYLEELIHHLRDHGFGVGLRTNGFLAEKKLAVINACDLSAGLSIHTLNPVTQKMILGRRTVPDWATILNGIERPRVSIVLNRCNEAEFFSLIDFLSDFDHIRYIQVRRVSTDTRRDILEPDMVAYERVYTKVREIFRMNRRLWVDAEEYEIYGMNVVFWRTVKTSISSLNYFTDGTISDEYFIVEGYLRYYRDNPLA